MNVAYAVAVALLDGDVLVDQFTQARINSDDVWALIDRTVTHHEKAYDHLPADEQLTTQVRLTFKDGSTRAAKVVHPRGTGDRNLTNADIRDKYVMVWLRPGCITTRWPPGSPGASWSRPASWRWR